MPRIPLETNKRSCKNFRGNRKSVGVNYPCYRSPRPHTGMHRISCSLSTLTSFERILRSNHRLHRPKVPVCHRQNILLSCKVSSNISALSSPAAKPISRQLPPLLSSRLSAMASKSSVRTSMSLKRVVRSLRAQTKGATLRNLSTQTMKWRRFSLRVNRMGSSCLMTKSLSLLPSHTSLENK